MGRGDVDVVDGVVELAVDAAYAPRPRRAELLLESEDQLVLVNRIHVGIDLRTQVAYGAVALIVAEAELRPEDRPRIGDAVALADLPAIAAIERAFRSAARRVGQGCVSTCISRWW